jgi:HSP20 family protein
MGKYTTLPWLEIQGMKEKMDKLMDEMRERFEHDPENREQVALWRPVTDAYETPQAYVVQIELPGLDRSKIRLEVKDRELWVYGERRMLKEVAGATYQILERSYGPFARKFMLPSHANTDKITASTQDGLLTITVPKEAQSSSVTKIKVIEE